MEGTEEWEPEWQAKWGAEDAARKRLAEEIKARSDWKDVLEMVGAYEALLAKRHAVRMRFQQIDAFVCLLPSLSWTELRHLKASVSEAIGMREEEADRA